MHEELAELPFIAGPGRYQLDVVGESFYQNHLGELCGERKFDGVNLKVRARLWLEDDNPYDRYAVCVAIDDFTVGYLSRDCARAFRRRVRYGPLSVHEAFECEALICGGWDRGPNNIASYGVRLDVDLKDD